MVHLYENNLLKLHKLNNTKIVANELLTLINATHKRTFNYKISSCRFLSHLSPAFTLTTSLIIIKYRN